MTIFSKKITNFVDIESQQFWEFNLRPVQFPKANFQVYFVGGLLIGASYMC